MIVKVTDKVLDYKGEPVKKDGKDLVWRDVIFTALNTISPNDPNENMATDKKQQAYVITKKVFDSETVDLSIEDRSFILERVRAMYMPLIVGRAEEFLDESKKVEKIPA